MRVLIADDDPVSLHGLRGLMQSWGYDVATAANGTAALSALAAPDAPRLALIDWEMPGLHGPDVCRKVRDWHSADSPYLILLTSRSSPLTRARRLSGSSVNWLSARWSTCN